MTLACLASDIPPGEGRTAIVEGVRVAIFNTPSGWRCVEADCTHRGGPLADGLVADRSVACPLHARRFDLDTGEPIGHDCPALVVHAIEERGGRLYVSLTQTVRVAA